MNLTRLPDGPRKKRLTICPCCGFRFEGALSEGCVACGAVPVGEALPKPDHELPSYARSLLLAVTGALMVIVFLTQTVVVFIQRAPRVESKLALSSMLSLDFVSWLAAAETAAWRLKWVAIPVTIVVLWGSRKIYRSMLQAPSRFCGFGYARSGLVASALVPALIAVLIGVTVPERLRRRQWGIEAIRNAAIYRTDRAMDEYTEKFETLPTALKDLLARLPDPDGSLAAALKEIDSAEYKTTADLAALPRQGPPALRGAMISNASADTATDSLPTEAVSFTTYEIRLAGEDKLMRTEDDVIVQDGVIMRASDVRKPLSGTSTSNVKP